MPDETPRRAPEEWTADRCPDDVREALRRPVDLGAEARARLAAALEEEPRPSAAPRLTSAASWIMRPLALPPLAMGVAAAALLLAGVLAGERLSRARAGAPARTAVAAAPAGTASRADGMHADTVRVVRFVLVAPGAVRVALVGDFNAWDPARTPMRGGGDGVWTVELPVSDGRHLYAFVVDGTRWVVDPAAPLAPEDDFGTRNSVLVVGAET